MESNKTISLEDECNNDNDCLFVAGDGLFRVWHVILIVAVITLAIIVVLFRVIKCPRLPEESRKRKELEERRARGEDGTGSNLELNNSDGHLMAARATSPYEGNVDQPLVPPGNVDLPLSPPFQQPPQDFNVVYNPSATSYQQQPPPSANRYSYDPSNTVELRYIRSRTTSEMGRDSYYDHHAEPAPPTNDDSSHPVVSTSTRI